jgi:tetratricopeptide (TPR) repeat protein
MSMNNIALTLSRQGRFADAEKLLRETLDIKRHVLAPEHPSILSSMGSLGMVLTRQGRFAEGEKLLRETLEIQRRVLGPRHPDATTSEYNVVVTNALAGKREEALGLLRENIDHGLTVSDALEMEKDRDLESLRGDPRFTALLAHAKEVAAAAEKPK